MSQTAESVIPQMHGSLPIHRDQPLFRHPLNSNMKSNNNIRNLLAAIGAASITISSATAVDYWWDTNGATGGFGNTNGTWGTSTFWSTDITGASATANTTITSADTVNFGTATLNMAGGTIGVASGGVTVGSIVTGAGQTTNITLGTSGNAITIHGGITKNGIGTLNITSPIILGADQTWTNNSSTNLSTPSGTNFITNGGFDLTIDGTGTTVFGVLDRLPKVRASKRA